MMTLTRDDLWSLEEYARERESFRAKVMAHKKDRQVLVGKHMLMIFEDETTIRYQIQEMLRVERVFEPEGIQDELDAYNPLIPDGKNLKVSMLIQYEDVVERKRQLAKLIGIEDQVWLQFGSTGKVFAIADEDMERDNEEKTSSVHFLRYEFNDEQIAAAKAGEPLVIGVDHEHYPVDELVVAENIRASLAANFD